MTFTEHIGDIPTPLAIADVDEKSFSILVIFIFKAVFLLSGKVYYFYVFLSVYVFITLSSSAFLAVGRGGGGRESAVFAYVGIGTCEARPGGLDP